MFYIECVYCSVNDRIKQSLLDWKLEGDKTWGSDGKSAFGGNVAGCGKNFYHQTFVFTLLSLLALWLVVS